MQWLRHRSWLYHKDADFIPGTQHLAISAWLGWSLATFAALIWAGVAMSALRMQGKRWDQRQRIRFTDIDAPSFQPADIGLTREALMAQMHGRLLCGTWLTGVEVFRQMYAAVGFGAVVWLSRLPLISPLLDVGYSVFARYRLQLTGWCTAETCSATAAKVSVCSSEKQRP